MKKIPLLLACLCFAACSTSPQSPTAFKFQSDVLYFVDSAGGRKAASEVTALFGGRQEVAIVSEKIPPLQPPAPIFQALPEYPPALKAAGVGGEVTVDFIIDESGSVPYADVVATTHSGLNAAAIDAIRKWKFRPAQRMGMNVRSHLRVPVTFTP